MARDREPDDVAEREEAPESVIEEWREKPVAVAREDLTRLIREQGEAAVPLLRALSLGEGVIAREATRALGFVKERAAATALAEIAAASPRRDVQKEARRSLHRLRSEGIVPVAPVEKVEKQARPAHEYYRTLASPIDGMGSRLLYLGLSRALGAVQWFGLVLNGYRGIVDAATAEFSRSEFDEHLQKSAEHFPFKLIDIPPQYAVALVREAFQRNKAVGKAAPRDYLLWQRALGGGEAEPFQPLIYQEVSSAEVRLNPLFLDDSGELFAQPEFEGWTFDVEEMRPFATEMVGAQTSMLVLSEQAREERSTRILGSALQSTLAGERRGIFKRLMEEMAHYLLQTDRPRHARQALAVALSLEETSQTPLPGVPFLREMMELTFSQAVHLGTAGRLARPVRKPAPRYTIGPAPH